ncbi:MAG TPA: PHB depolymerase family esterase, partial [Polyangiaceae bacterium]
LEREAAGAAVFVYPRAPNSAPGWPFFNDAGRTIEAKFITAVIVALEAELNIDPKRVFLAGWDGGAVMVNALACRLGTNVLRGVAAHSGSLYEVPRDDGMGNDFEFDLDTGVTSCPLPDALLIWGKADQSGGTTYAADGTKTRNWYRATLGCQPSTQPWTSSPACVSDTTCPRSFVWCPIEGLGHSIWPGAAAAIWRFFDGLR